MSLTLLFCVFCCFPQASGAIYQSLYSSLTCSGTPTTTSKLTSTTCVATANGPQSTNMYVTAAMVASAGATYEIDSFSASCGTSPLYINAYLNPSCTNSGTCSSSTGSFGAVTTVCPSSGTGSGSGSGNTIVSGPGSVNTGYAVQSISYAASDTQCTGQSFTSAALYVLGICVAPSGSTVGNIFTSDVRCVFVCSSPRYLCVTNVSVLCLLLFLTGIGCYLSVCVCVINL